MRRADRAKCERVLRTQVELYGRFAGYVEGLRFRSFDVRAQRRLLRSAVGRRQLAPQAFRTAVLIVLAALGLGLILRAAGWL